MSEKGGSPPCFDSMEEPLERWAEGYGFGEAPDSIRVFGVVVEVAGEGGTATFTAYRTGDASMHTSGGAVRSDWASPETVRQAAVALVERAESLLDSFAPAADAAAPPPPGHARFHLITDRGRYFHDESAEALSTDTGDLPALTSAANALFDEMRVVDESMQRADSGEQDRQ